MGEFGTCPIEGHNYNRKVERRIRQIKPPFEKNIQNERLSVLQWETLSSVIANKINDLPIGLGNVISDYENIGLITPNRLRLGRNNDLSPATTMKVTGIRDRVFERKQKNFQFMVPSIVHISCTKTDESS